MSSPLRIALFAVVVAGAAALAQGRTVLREGTEQDDSFFEIIVEQDEDAKDAGAGLPEGAPPLPERTRTLLGVQVTVTLGQRVPEAEAQTLLEAAFAPFEWADAHLSQGDGSPITSVNGRASVHAVMLAPEVCEVLREALGRAEATFGLYDPTVAVAERLWAVGGPGPEKDALAEACEKVGHARVEVRNMPLAVRNPPCGVRFGVAGMRLSLEPYARAWATDRAGAALQSRGAQGFVIRAGSVGLAFGVSEDGALELAVPRGGAAGAVVVLDRAFATSQSGGRTPVDPRTCRPAPPRQWVVLGPDARQAWLQGHLLALGGGVRTLAALEERQLSAVLAEGDAFLFTRDLAGVLGPPPPDGGTRRFQR
jgi:thiamine biosynthesis lipoprotein ApbE